MNTYTNLEIEFYKAAFVCDFAAVRALLAKGANPNIRDEEQRTPLHQAVLGNSVGLLALLIESGADLNAQDDQGFTALHFAAQEFLPAMVKLLVAKGSDVNICDIYGNSVLWTAVAWARGRDEIVRYLLANGANADLANHEGVTPRNLAQKLGCPIE